MNESILNFFQPQRNSPLTTNRASTSPGNLSSNDHNPDDDIIEDDVNKAITEKDINEGLASGKIERIDGFDYHAGRFWIYPLNRDIRDYQYCIVYKALFNNTLVVLPTGLGKTLIAAVVMYNFYLWYPQCKIVFMAPTRPLVKQQMEACHDIVGIPKEDIVELTGHTPPERRREEWETKRLFFLTPQVMQNDLFINDCCPAHLIKCIVVDEAHKATGAYAYTRVVEEVYKRNRKFRVLALSATPGKDLMHIKQVVQNMLISKIEYRSEESLDVQRYTFSRNIEKIVVQLDDELKYYRDKLLKIIEDYLQTLVKRKAIGGYDLNRLSSYHMLMQKKAYEAGQHNIPPALLGSIRFTFAITISLIYSLDLLKNHGLRSFYNHIRSTKTEEGGDGETKKKKQFNLMNVLKKNTILQEILEDLRQKFQPDGNMTFHGDAGATSHSVPGHPKLVKLQEIVVNHIIDKGESTRIMIFSQFRDSVEEITCLLKQHEPLVRPMMFVGQSSVKRRGFSQKQQLEVVKKFRDGGFNVLVATCVAEEGLDIGNVDLIICYDTSKSPIRLVQRCGRTGRAREGKIIILVTEGKEEESYKDSVYNRKRVKDNLLSGIKANDLYKENERLFPRGFKPICRKLYLGIKSKETNSEEAAPEEDEQEDKPENPKRRSSVKSGKRKSSTPGTSGRKRRKNKFIYNDDDPEDNLDDTPSTSREAKPKTDKSSTSKRRRKSKKDTSSESLENTMEKAGPSNSPLETCSKKHRKSKKKLDMSDSSIKTREKTPKSSKTKTKKRKEKENNENSFHSMDEVVPPSSPHESPSIEPKSMVHDLGEDSFDSLDLDPFSMDTSTAKRKRFKSPRVTECPDDSRNSNSPTRNSPSFSIQSKRLKRNISDESLGDGFEELDAILSSPPPPIEDESEILRDSINAKYDDIYAKQGELCDESETEDETKENSKQHENREITPVLQTTFSNEHSKSLKKNIDQKITRLSNEFLRNSISLESPAKETTNPPPMDMNTQRMAGKHLHVPTSNNDFPSADLINNSNKREDLAHQSEDELLSDNDDEFLRNFNITPEVSRLAERSTIQDEDDLLNDDDDDEFLRNLNITPEVSLIADGSTAPPYTQFSLDTAIKLINQ